MVNNIEVWVNDTPDFCYDGACGMLTTAQAQVLTLAERRDKNVSIRLSVKEINQATYAICKADMLLNGDGGEYPLMSTGI